ncbi:hypothetical protein C4D60_Mb08t14520 [Musa balbisiana]|uniref:Uncharacterized protein n=1 Tax=Musa balbisiana TaxID=52838 RepID=A0A4S8K3W2_MUSBA|nr:hypothetical protein C4D60_Mb08t14520 [Musa balbisiana]
MSRHATALCSTIPNQYVPSLVSDMPFPCVWAMRRRCKKVQIRSHKTLPTAAKAGSTSDDELLHSPDPEGAGKKGTMLGDDLEVVCLRTMAQETQGDWGGNLATVAYLFLGYTCVVAYTSKSGEVLSHLIGFPASTLGNLFTLLVALLILVGGTTITDQVNQWLTVTMIGLAAGFSLSKWLLQLRSSSH